MRIKALVKLALTFVIFLFLFYDNFSASYQINRGGVRVIKVVSSGKKGVVKEIYAPGATYFFMPIINEWYTFDAKLQNMGDDRLLPGARGAGTTWF